jgi:hypothetical protein
MDKFTEKGLTIVEAAYEGYTNPQKEGRHEPDIRARDGAGLIFIGEAKRCEDLKSSRTQEQFEDFSGRRMKSDQKQVPFHVIVPKSCVQDIWSTLDQLGLKDKPNITVWSHA